MKKEFIAGGLIALLAAGAGGVANELMSKPEVQVKTVEVPKIIEKEVVKTVEVPKIVEKQVNNTVEVPVDNKNLDKVLNFVYEKDGQVEYVTDDLDDDEVSKIADRIIFEMETLKLASDAIKEELFDEIDGKNVDGVELDEDDLERLDINDDLDDIEVLDVDYDNKDITFRMTGEFEQDDIEYEFRVDVVFKDGEFDELDNIRIN